MPLLPLPSVTAWANRIATAEPPHPDDRLAELQALDGTHLEIFDRLDELARNVPDFSWSFEDDRFSFTCSTSNKCRKTTELNLFSDDHPYITVVCLCCGHETVVPVYCGNRFCPVCGKRRQQRVRERLNWLIKNRKRHRGTLLKHLTLTVKNEQNLPDMIKHLTKSFRRMRQRKAFKQYITGGAFVIELTKKGEGWHAHIHCIIQSYKVEWKMLRDMWIKCSKGSSGVYIQNIPPVEAVRYLTKYVSQCDLNEPDQITASDALKGCRLFNPFGEWYAINADYQPPLTYCSECNSPSDCIPLNLIYSGSPHLMNSP